MKIVVRTVETVCYYSEYSVEELAEYLSEAEGMEFSEALDIVESKVTSDEGAYELIQNLVNDVDGFDEDLERYGDVQGQEREVSVEVDDDLE